MRKIRSIFLVALCLTSFLTDAQSVYTLIPSDTPSLAGNKFVFLRDATHKMTLDEALRSNNYEENHNAVPDYDVTNDAIWGKIKLTCKQSAEWYLILDPGVLNKIEFYQKRGNGNWTEKDAGSAFPGEDVVFLGHIALKLDVEPGDTTLLMFRVHDFQPLQFGIRIGTLKSFVNTFHNTDLYYGICFGVIFMMCLYNWYLYFTQRQKVYLFYVMYVFCNAIFLLVFSGYFFHLPVVLRKIVLFDPVIFPAAFGVFLVLFTIELFKEHLSKRRITVLYIFVAMTILEAFVGATPYKLLAFNIIRGLGLLLGVICLRTGFVGLNKGSSAAKFYLIGFSCYLGGLAFLILSGHLIPANTVAIMVVVTGSMLECIFLSFAQADKLKVFQMEKERAQQETVVQMQRNERLIKEQNVVLEQKVNERTAELAEKNKEILDSIHYAERIQSTLLAHEALLKQNIPEHFILFKPKDIVSGDFYWATQVDNRFYLAACDSTGHGVPGAFMSLLNISFLNEAINEKDIVSPNEVFNYVRSHLINSISRDGGRDGMDGILVCFQGGLKLSYVAANNEPIIIRNGGLIELPADKMPVGQGEKTDSFTLHDVQLQKGDMLYLYTDGYADQFGGPKGKKFKHKQVGEKLLEISQKAMPEQKAALENIFNEWKGDLEQIDDVLVIGVRI